MATLLLLLAFNSISSFVKRTISIADDLSAISSTSPSSGTSRASDEMPSASSVSSYLSVSMSRRVEPHRQRSLCA